MKNILPIAFALLLTLAIPAGSALALGVYDPIPIQIINPTGVDPNQGVVNGLNDINNSINAQTQALQDAQTQQQLAALNQNCVAYVTADINAKETYIKQLDQQINEYIAQNAGKARSNEENQAYASHLNYLYTLRKAQNQKYTNIIISQCSSSALNSSCIKSFGSNSEIKSVNATTGATQCKCASGYIWNDTDTLCVEKQVQQTTPTPGLQCNGKSWNTCPTGYNFSCLSSGDPTCTPQQQPQVAPPIVKAKPVVIINNTPLAKPKTPIVASSVANTSKDTIQPAITPAPAKKGLWAWFKGLFGF